MILGVCLLAVVACNIAVVLLAFRNSCLREKAKRDAPNVVELRFYRRTDVVV